MCDRHDSSGSRTCERNVRWLGNTRNEVHATSMLADEVAVTVPPRLKSPTESLRVADRTG
jgi:hypothetical protein